MQAYGLDKWHVSVGLLVLAGMLYVLNIFLRFFVKAKVTESMNDEAEPVPKWIQTLGLLSISSLVATAFPWVFAFSEGFGLFLALMVFFLLVMFVKISRSIRKGGGSMTMMMLGATDEFYNEEKRKAIKMILEQQAGDKLEEQNSGDPEDSRGNE